MLFLQNNLTWEKSETLRFEERIQNGQGLIISTKVNCSEENCKNSSSPLFITVQFEKQFLSWNLPYKSLFDESLVVYEVNQKLCVIRDDPKIDQVDLAIEIKAPRCGSYHKVPITTTRSHISNQLGKFTNVIKNQKLLKLFHALLIALS